MSHSEIISTSRTLLNAGSETTSTTVAATTYYLLQNPDILHRVQSEVRAAFKTADDITLHAVSSPNRLPYLEAVLKESLRCFPPVPTKLPRIVGPAGAVIDGSYVSRNVLIYIYCFESLVVTDVYLDHCRRPRMVCIPQQRQFRKPGYLRARTLDGQSAIPVP